MLFYYYVQLKLYNFAAEERFLYLFPDKIYMMLNPPLETNKQKQQKEFLSSGFLSQPSWRQGMKPWG